jgi:hypothetical protein
MCTRETPAPRDRHVTSTSRWTGRTSRRSWRPSGRSGSSIDTAEGVDMLVDAREPRARSAVHLLFVREKVRSDYVEPDPDFSPPVRTAERVLLAPVADLVRMKLTSFRLKDRVHLQDMDSVGLIASDLEASLPQVLRQRLREVRATE